MILGLLTIDTMLELHFDIEPHLARRGHRRAYVIGLHRARRQQGVGALRQRLADIELQLSALVAAKRQPSAIVALDPDIGAKLGADIIEQLQRGRRMTQVDAGKIFYQ